jgi:hypothetical protein
MFQRLLILVIAMALAHCSDSDFAGQSKKGGDKSDSQSNTKDDGKDGGQDDKQGDNGANSDLDQDFDGDLDFGGDSNGDGDSGGGTLTFEEVKELKSKCWFAVSGTWAGHPSYTGKYQSKFPLTTSGNPIAHGEGFDNVGGVFLEASTTPYQYGQGAKEIDQAVDSTFDSILVAPGMHAVLKDAAGTVLFDGEGPLVAGSAYYENQNKWKGKYRAALLTRTDLPQWITDYLNANANVASLTLHSARYVLVSSIKNSDCDFKQ